METYNGENRQERRKKRVFTPMIYFLSELTLAWLIISIANLSFQIFAWASWSYIAMFTIFTHTAYKTYSIYMRQKYLRTT
ncbi:hypothetical protein MNB_SV-12-1838 [hydrothermal vent metagenome]|uniref:Uncharacterized protein n=1 Tax=hydrothermal vent metagenome TaxID=652676 RepID=A0A1W1B9K1_9ZZZZ